MLFTTCKENLEEKLNTVARIVPTRSTTPILENIVIRVLNGTISILANNSEIYMQTTITAMALEDGEVAVNGKLFSELIRKLPANEEITIKTDKKQLNIQAGKSKVSLLYMDTKTYPEPPSVEKKDSITFTVAGKLFRKALQNTIYAAKKTGDNTAFSSMNLVIEKDKDNLYLCSLDGHRIAKNYIQLNRSKKECSKECNIIIPINTCQELLKTRFEEMEFIVTKNHITLCSGNFMMISSLIAGQYFDTSKIGIDNSLCVQVRRQTLEDSISRSLVLLNEKTPLRIHIEQGEMVLSYYSNNGKLNESIEIMIDDAKKTLEIGFNPVFLLDALKATEEDTVNLNFKNATSPCIIQNDTALHIVMPVALKCEAA